MSNPYAVSQVNLDAADQVSLVDAKKPKAVLLMQVAAVGFMILLLGALVNHKIQSESTWIEVIVRMMSEKGGYRFLGALAVPVVLIVSLQRRMLLGRILGLAAIAGISTPVWIQIFTVRFDSVPGALGSVVAWLGITGPLLYWAYALSFSQRARAYFVPASS